MDTRVQDYLDDKLQSAADLDSLDSLLENVREQQLLLKQQLDDARRDHAETRHRAEKTTQSIHHKATAFQQEQQDIDRRLLIVTQSETSDDAVQKFEKSMERLRKLDMAAGYVELLKEVDNLRSECVAQLGKSDDLALEPYRRLQQLVASLRPLQEAAEGAAPHLLDHIVSSVQQLRRTIQTSFSEDLEKTLKKMNWPKPSATVPLALQQEWVVNIGRLLDLQKHDLEDREHNIRRSPENEPPVLLPFEVLVLPLSQRFTYHFSGDKPTNRTDKPEYFLTHTLDLISTYSDFIQNSVQPILLRHFRKSELAFTPAYIDATTAFITALVPMLKSKITSFASQVANQPPLLSHLVQEVIQFDTTLQESYDYTPSSPSIPWRGLSFYLLDANGYFQPWLSAEKDFALSRYHAIVESAEAGELDFDAVSADATKPTRAAIRVNDLLETITERYRNLSSFSQKVRFLIDIQIEIFDRYHRRLQSGLEAYLGMTSTVGRTMHGLTKEQLAELQGVRGLDRICRVFGSADYLERAMRDWSDDVFFLELWVELEYRSKNAIGQNIGSWQEVQQKTSSALGVSDTDGTLQGALFDETAASYQRLRVRSESILVDTMTYDIRQALKSYASISTWSSLTSSHSNSVSPELDPTLTILADYFAFLRRALGKAPLRRISRQICHLIQTYVWDHLLHGSRTTFSTAGATQLTTDMRAVCAGIDKYVGNGQARVGMRKLLEGITLLSLPVRGEIARKQTAKSTDSNGDDEASAWGGEEDGEGEVAQGKQMSLFQAERLVFMDNEGARYALEQLGLETLSEAEARTVLGKRVEVGS
ncbi:unnamed protein product [Zymoseptoria tritici ST99CH_1A5]|uniref:RINT-1 family protein n=2 Tax=Zymoseptoria tritici TaxID=1047171 RepID=A0A2H1H387_ZYMTR|nr:unnamed protein product [Zymoseptoria tritici ST99CH_1E4]SMR63359.1 unnamed protein product [Zymoseptoria tritici ST99CH_3D1]SMY28702.1 unnamed protein product [Zymoseptoria tritici ST99CH_1A5]